MNVKTHHEDQLIAGLQRSDEAAFAEVFNIYKGKLYSFAFRFLKNRETSEEIVQETLIILWTNRLSLDIKYPLGPFLYTIARRLTLNALRNAATAEAAKEKLWADLKQAHNDTEDTMLLADLEAFTEQSIAKLPTQQQLIFRLSRYEGLTHDQIAETLNISKNTVNNHLVRALKTLRKQFKDSGISYSLLIGWFFIK